MFFALNFSLTILTMCTENFYNFCIESLCYEGKEHNENYKNIPSVIPQMGSEEGRVYADVTPTFLTL